MTARDLIHRAAQLIGAIASGETMTASEAQDGLSSLNSMVESWSTENLLIYYKPREEFLLVPNQQTYTIGAGGDFDSSRPLKIEQASIVLDSGDEHSVKIINQQEWSEITLKDEKSSYPFKLYYETDAPFGKINLWPTPSAAIKLILYSHKPLLTIDDLDTDLDLPPGYLRAMRFNLAIEMAPEYGVTPTIEVKEIAQKALANIKRMNSKELLMKTDFGGKKFDIFVGPVAD